MGLLGTFAHEIAHAHQHATVSVDGSTRVIHGWKDTPEGRAYEEARRKDWEQVGKSPLDATYGRGTGGGVALTETAAETCAHYWSVERWGGRTAYGLLEVEAPNRYKWAEKWVPISSINTYIPAMQAKGVEVVYDPRVFIDASKRPPMYWADTDAGTLHRLVGAEVENLLPSIQNAVTGLALDTIHGKIYWTEKTGERTGKIRRANLDGTNAQLVKSLTSVPVNIALDTANRKIYVTNSWGKVQRMNFNGSNFQPNLITDLESPDGIAVDAINGKVYWTEKGGISRANLNGKNIENIVTGLDAPANIALGVIPTDAAIAAAPSTVMGIPGETDLYANYPNPFNPETWIPYQLAAPADVRIAIYAIDGKLVRILNLGHQPLGHYDSRSRAAYWDGKNDVGEPVASGLYFYTLTAGDFTATRKLLIRK